MKKRVVASRGRIQQTPQVSPRRNIEYHEDEEQWSQHTGARKIAQIEPGGGDVAHVEDDNATTKPRRSPETVETDQELTEDSLPSPGERCQSCGIACFVG
jgi:hypothetical protein